MHTVQGQRIRPSIRPKTIDSPQPTGLPSPHVLPTSRYLMSRTSRRQISENATASHLEDSTSASYPCQSNSYCKTCLKYMFRLRCVGTNLLDLQERCTRLEPCLANLNCRKAQAKTSHLQGGKLQRLPVVGRKQQSGSGGGARTLCQRWLTGNDLRQANTTKGSICTSPT